MSKWTYDNAGHAGYNIKVNGLGWASINDMFRAHNSDCDQYEARIAELESQCEAARQYAHDMDRQNVDYGKLVDRNAELERRLTRSIIIAEYEAKLSALERRLDAVMARIAMEDNFWRVESSDGKPGIYQGNACLLSMNSMNQAQCEALVEDHNSSIEYIKMRAQLIAEGRDNG